MRVTKRLHNLRLVVFTIMGSMTSLLGTVAVVGFIVYAFAVLLLSGVVEYFRSAGPAETDTVGAELKRWYGGLYSTMVTLFMAITGGVDWYEVMHPLSRLSPIYGLMFVVYVFFLYFGVLNVVMAAFVSATAEIAAQDRDAVVNSQLSR